MTNSAAPATPAKTSPRRHATPKKYKRTGKLTAKLQTAGGMSMEWKFEHLPPMVTFLLVCVLNRVMRYDSALSKDDEASLWAIFRAMGVPNADVANAIKDEP